MPQTSDTLKCNGLNCSSEILAEAHIIPRAFAREVREGGRSIEMRPEKVGYAKRQLGKSDRGILCKECDKRLGPLDQYAINVCRSFKATHKRHSQGFFELPDVDGEKLSKFVLALLWRASISRLPDFRTISFGEKYEKLACEVLFDVRSLSDFPQFSVILLRYISPHLDLEKIYTLPSRNKFGEINSYDFALGGFRFIAKLDARGFNRILEEFQLRREHPPQGIFFEFEKTPEFKNLTEMVVNHHRRGHKIN